jgi:predicted helicase
MVEKVGDRLYWENWARKVGDIARKFIYRITNLVKEGQHKVEFESFLTSLQQNVNPAVSAGQPIEMLAQHMITRPVFEALFQEYNFATNNAVGRSMQAMLNRCRSEQVNRDTDLLASFYDNVRKYVRQDR